MSHLPPLQVKKFHPRLLVLLLAPVFILSGCKKDPVENIEVAPLEPEYGITIFQTDFTLRDAYNLVDDTLDEFLVIDEDDVFRFVFDYEYISLEAQEYIQVDGFGQAGTVDGTIPGGFLPAGIEIDLEVADSVVTIEFESGEGLSQPDADLERVDFKGGRLSLAVEWSVPHDVTLYASIPGLSLNGVPYEDSLTFDYVPGITNLPMTDSLVIDDLNGYQLDLTLGDLGFNQIAYTLNGTVTTESPTGLTDQDVSVGYDIGISDIDWQGLYGFLENFEVPFDEAQDRSEIDFFGDLGLEVFELGDPSLVLTVQNQAGHEIDGTVDTLAFYYETQGTRFLEGTYQTDLADVEPASGPGQVTTTTNSISNDNSNLSEALVLEDGEIEFQFDAAVNSSGKDPAQNYFLLDTSKVIATVEGDIPLEFRTTSPFVFEDTLDDVSFDFVDGEQASSVIQEVELRFDFRNGFPMDLSIQFYGYDSLGVFVDSLLSDPIIIKSAPVDGDGFASGTNDYRYEIIKTGIELDDLQSITQLHWKATAETADKGADYVVFESTTGMYIGMGARVKLILDEELLDEDEE